MGLWTTVYMEQRSGSNAWCAAAGEVQRRLGALGELRKCSVRSPAQNIGAKKALLAFFCLVLLNIRL